MTKLRVLSPPFLCLVNILKVLAGCFIKLSARIFVVRLREHFLRRVGACITLSLVVLFGVRNGAAIVSVNLANVFEMRTPNGNPARSCNRILLLYNCTR